jgi:dolichyl-diphosphooligosaccharide--protein glycosyltransferase
MSEHGYEKFSTWFDDKVWHPLGRPVGTTTYPGMMLTSATLHRALNSLGYPS